MSKEFISPASLESEVVYASAYAAALTGQLIYAKALFKGKTLDNLSAKDLDLLARIEMQRGDQSRATELWRRALEREPQFQPAMEALKMLDTSWRLKYNSLQLIRFIIPTVLLLGIGYGLGLFWSGLKNTDKTSNQEISQLSPASASSEQPYGIILNQLFDTLLHCKDLKVKMDAGVLVVDMGLPIFSSRCRINKDVVASLNLFGEIVRNYSDNVTIELLGSTDCKPIIPNSTYISNEHLRLERAITMIRFFHDRYGIPITDFSASVMVGYPYPDSTLRSNRTCFIRIRRK